VKPARLYCEGNAAPYMTAELPRRENNKEYNIKQGCGMDRFKVEVQLSNPRSAERLYRGGKTRANGSGA